MKRSPDGVYNDKVPGGAVRPVVRAQPHVRPERARRLVGRGDRDLSENGAERVDRDVRPMNDVIMNSTQPSHGR